MKRKLTAAAKANGKLRKTKFSFVLIGGKMNRVRRENTGKTFQRKNLSSKMATPPTSSIWTCLNIFLPSKTETTAINVNNLFILYSAHGTIIK